ncbi:MAG: hypothetical protein S4CHLAM20_02620 [Chlamydiia bacterium]|nr:hypothetical protein [Chlamydiia bacterium]
MHFLLFLNVCLIEPVNPTLVREIYPLAWEMLQKEADKKSSFAIEKKSLDRYNMAVKKGDFNGKDKTSI